MANRQDEWNPFNLEIGSCYGQSLMGFAKAMPKGSKIRAIDFGRNDIPYWPNSGDV